MKTTSPNKHPMAQAIFDLTQEVPCSGLTVLVAISQSAQRDRMEISSEIVNYQDALHGGEKAPLIQSFRALWGQLQVQPGFQLSAASGTLRHYLHFVFHFVNEGEYMDTEIVEHAAMMEQDWKEAQSEIAIVDLELMDELAAWALAGIPPDDPSTAANPRWLLIKDILVYGVEEVRKNIAEGSMERPLTI